MRNSLLIWCYLVIALLLPDQMFGYWNDNADVGPDKDHYAITVITVAVCNIVDAMRGNVGQGISIIVVVGLGVGLFLGKVSMKVFLSCALGIGMLFGSTQIVLLLGEGEFSYYDKGTSCGGKVMRKYAASIQKVKDNHPYYQWIEKDESVD